MVRSFEITLSYADDELIAERIDSDKADEIVASLYKVWDQLFGCMMILAEHPNVHFSTKQPYSSVWVWKQGNSLELSQFSSLEDVSFGTHPIYGQIIWGLIDDDGNVTDLKLGILKSFYDENCVVELSFEEENVES